MVEFVKRFVPGLSIGLVCWFLAGAAYAGDSKAAAEALFVEGRNLVIQGDYAAACPKFEASQKLDPGLGTMLNLADCYEKAGRTASAWAQYREAIPAARAAGSGERANLAEERAKALESRLSTLTIQVMGEVNGQDVEVLRDGIPVDRAAIGTAIPVDPGSHEVVARAPGHTPWSTEIDVGKDHDEVEVNVPELEVARVANAGSTPTADDAAGGTWPAQKTWALATGGLGVLALGAGVVFGVMAGSELGAAKDGCSTYPNGCSSDSLNHNNNAHTFADVSTVTLIAGGVGLGLGTVLWFTAPSPKGSTQVGFGPGSLQVRGKF